MAQSAPGQSSSVDLELALLQNRAVRVYAAALELRAQAATAAVRNRQAGVAARRRIDVLRRQHQALMGRAAERLVDARRTWAAGGRVPTRVVVAHRDGRRPAQSLRSKSVDHPRRLSEQLLVRQFPHWRRNVPDGGRLGQIHLRRHGPFKLP